MTDSDLRELDGWIAEKFMGYTKIPNSNPLAWVKPEGGIVTWEPTSYDGPFQPTRLPSAFALVKREIERRGWSWRCDANPGYKFRFEIFAPNFKDPPLPEPQLGRESIEPYKATSVFANSEELAGCLAAKAAVEGSDAYPD